MAQDTPVKPDDKKSVPVSGTEKDKNATPAKEAVAKGGKAPVNELPRGRDRGVSADSDALT